MLTLLALLPLFADPSIQRLDLDADTTRQVLVDQEPGTYLGHVSSILLDDRATILIAYPKGHGSGPIILKRSTDAGKTWSDRLPTPDSFATSKETPTLFNLGQGNLILFSGLFPIRAARSNDHGRTWSQLEPIGSFGGIVAMGGLAELPQRKLVAFFHDDGRFFTQAGKAAGTFSLFQTDSADRGLTWSAPRAIWSGSDIHLCEPGVLKSPDGKRIALLLRENRRKKPSHVMITDDHAVTWSVPRPLPIDLTGDRHTAVYASDGRVVITYRCMIENDPWKGDWVAWIGDWNTIASAADGQQPPPSSSVLVRLKDNQSSWDCGYPGLERMPDGTFVATTYGHWTKGQQPWILSVRFTLDEIDRLVTAAK